MISIDAANLQRSVSGTGKATCRCLAKEELALVTTQPKSCSRSKLIKASAIHSKQDDSGAEVSTAVALFEVCRTCFVEFARLQGLDVAVSIFLSFLQSGTLTTWSHTQPSSDKP